MESVAGFHLRTDHMRTDLRTDETRAQDGKAAGGATLSRLPGCGIGPSRRKLWVCEIETTKKLGHRHERDDSTRPHTGGC